MNNEGGSTQLYSWQALGSTADFAAAGGRALSSAIEGTVAIAYMVAGGVSQASVSKEGAKGVNSTPEGNIGPSFGGGPERGG